MSLINDFIRVARIPSLMVTLMWFVHICSWLFELNINKLGVYPRTLGGTSGILLSPLIHGDISHLMSNSISLLVLGAALYYGYISIANKVFLLIYFLSGILVWLLGREAYHIGASGLVYGMFGFVFSGGILSKKRSLAVVGLAVFVLYGGVLYGIFPNQPGVSWESHLMGLIVGIILALLLVSLNDDSEQDAMGNANHTFSKDFEINYNLRESRDVTNEPDI